MVVVRVMHQVRADKGVDGGMLEVAGSVVRAGIGRCWWGEEAEEADLCINHEPLDNRASSRLYNLSWPVHAATQTPAPGYTTHLPIHHPILSTLKVPFHPPLQQPPPYIHPSGTVGSLTSIHLALHQDHSPTPRSSHQSLPSLL